MASFTSETIALIDQIYLLLQVERTLLESRDPDWDRLEDNLAGIGELFKLLPLSRKGPSGAGKAQFDPALRRQLEKVIALRRENAEILQVKVRELGCQIASLKQEKAALLAYTAGEDTAALLKRLV